MRVLRSRGSLSSQPSSLAASLKVRCHASLIFQPSPLKAMPRMSTSPSERSTPLRVHSSPPWLGRPAPPKAPYLRLQRVAGPTARPQPGATKLSVVLRAVAARADQVARIHIPRGSAPQLHAVLAKVRTLMQHARDAFGADLAHPLLVAGKALHASAYTALPAPYPPSPLPSGGRRRASSARTRTMTLRHGPSGCSALRRLTALAGASPARRIDGSRDLRGGTRRSSARLPRTQA